MTAARNGPRIRHTMLRVADLDGSVDFYTRLLGMRVMRRRENPKEKVAYVGYGEESAGHALELIQETAPAAAPAMGNRYGHVALYLPDIRATSAALKAAGVPFTMEPGRLRPDNPNLFAFVTDPDGYEIELTEVGG
jgi:lactoylglutathione lyase